MDESLSNLTDVNVTCKDDMESRNELLLKKIEELENEKKKNQEEFGLQRAKMKELFLQKEEELKKLNGEIKSLQSELDEARSQITVAELNLDESIRRYEEEISSLQKLVNEQLNGQETASLSILNNKNNSNYEIENLRKINEKLVTEITELKSNTSSSGGDFSSNSPLLTAPTAMFNTIAKKLQVTTNNVTSNISLPSGDSLEEEKRKAEEDTEVLRSLVVPLEAEIKNLKDMLRRTDEELRKYKNNVSIRSSSVQEEDNVFETSCDMIDVSEITNDISNSKIQNTSPSKSLNSNSSFKNRNSQSSTKSSDFSPPSHQQNISASDRIPIRDDTPVIINRSCTTCETRPCTNCETLKVQLTQFEDKIKSLEKHKCTLEKYKEELKKETLFREEMEKVWNEKKELHKIQVTELTEKTTYLEIELKDLRQSYNQTLDDVTGSFERLERDRRECQEHLQRVQQKNEELVGKYSKTSAELQNEFINLPNRTDELQEILLKLREDLIVAKVGKEDADRYREQIHIDSSNLRMELDRLQHDKEAGEMNLRQKISSLQKALKNQEKNQKDFVILSQSLQQELENMKSANEVRWQHEDDIENCNGCKNLFSSTKDKVHCCHCGKLFCQTCLKYTILSGPNKRPSLVCSSCNVILVKDISGSGRPNS